jgi:hypothetical protein
MMTNCLRTSTSRWGEDGVKTLLRNLGHGLGAGRNAGVVGFVCVRLVVGTLVLGGWGVQHILPQLRGCALLEGDNAQLCATAEARALHSRSCRLCA